MGHALHFGEPFPQDGVWYQARGGTLRSGLLAVEFLFTDQPAGRGGNPGARAGDVIMFTEAVAHGTLPWRSRPWEEYDEPARRE